MHCPPRNRNGVWETAHEEMYNRVVQLCLVLECTKYLKPLLLPFKKRVKSVTVLFLFNFSLLLCKFHNVYPNPTHFPVASYLQSILAMPPPPPPAPPKEKSLTLEAAMDHSASLSIFFCTNIFTCKCSLR